MYNQQRNRRIRRLSRIVASAFKNEEERERMSYSNCYRLIPIVLGLALFGGNLNSTAAAESRPTIVLVMSEDVG